MLLGSVSIADMLIGLLSYRSFFTDRHQLGTVARAGKSSPTADSAGRGA
jgi:hypothetical protein